MGKIDVRSIDFEDEYYETYEKFTKRNRKQTIDEGDLQQSQGKSGRGRKGDSYITQRTKGRSRSQ